MFDMQLNGGHLDGANLSVTSVVEHRDVEDANDSAPIDQSDKPRAGSKAHCFCSYSKEQ